MLPPVTAIIFLSVTTCSFYTNSEKKKSFIYNGFSCVYICINIIITTIVVNWGEDHEIANQIQFLLRKKLCTFTIEEKNATETK